MIVKFTNGKGYSLEFQRNGSFRLNDITGLGGVDATIQTEKAPYQDGTTYINNYLNPRTISMTFSIFSQDQIDMDQKRERMGRVFNSKSGMGVLRIDKNGVIREIPAIVDAGPDYPSGTANRTKNFQRAIVTLHCPNPFWLAIQEETTPMSSWIGGMTFPWNLSSTKFATKGSRMTLNNNGDVDAPVEITFFGPATNPIISNNTTGEYIKILKELGQYDKLVIRTDFGGKTVKIVDGDGIESNAFHYIDLNSTFWQMLSGPNEIEYDADLGQEQARVQIKWRNRFVAI